MTGSSNAYNDVLYESFSYPQSHPDRLSTIATLFGMNPQPLDSARVLEIGCASGGNLLPMAAACPGSKFVGIDLSSRHIAEAQAGVDALNLGNVQLHAMGLEQAGAALGEFDYIIAHGVYSWVAAPIREKLMALCASRLKPMGVAYLSYNTLPGSSTRSALREMARFHTRNVLNFAERVNKARSLFAFLEMGLKERDDPYALSMRQELSEASGLQDFYIAHEYLEEVNEPCYFHELIEHAQKHGLQFLGEAEIQAMSASGYSTEFRTGLREMAGSIVEAEQYGDFVKNRAFRHTLLCRADVQLKRAILPARIHGFHLASSAEPMGETGEPHSNSPMEFRDADGVVIQAAEPLLKAALLELRAIWPQSISFAKLLDKSTARTGLLSADNARNAAILGNCLLACYSASRAVEFHASPFKFYPSVSEFPKAAGLARWQASRGSRVTNLRHENIILGAMENALLQKLDGTFGLSALEAEFPEARAILNRFAGGALLVS